MNANVGNTDKLIRVVLAIVAGGIAFAVGAGSVLGIILLLVAAILLVTSAVSFCPIYRALGMSTGKPKAH